MEIPVIKNENYKIIIDDLGSRGEGIGKIEGFTVFVEGGIPGDILNILIVKVKKNYAYGKLMEIITPSKNRITPTCKYYKRCGGCQIQHIDYKEQLNIKRKIVLDNLERIGGIKGVSVSETIGMDYPYYYRNKAQFPVKKGKNGIDIGFYSLRSHDIVDIECCEIQHKNNEKVLKIVKDFINKYNISVYDEVCHKGLIRHVLTKTGFTTNDFMVCIIINGKSLPKSEFLVKELKKIDGLKSVILNINTEKTNVILGERCKTIYGNPYITDYIGDIKFEISALSFFQVNPVQTYKLYSKVVEFAEFTGNENVLDIYCGLGSISLFIAKYVKSVFGVEIVEQAIEDAKRNAKLNNIQNAKFKAGKAEEVIPEIYEEGFTADIVILDPPRKGCEKNVIQTVVNMKPKKIVYVSCDPSTLARDLKDFLQCGYRLENVQPVDMFPSTVHVETIVLLTT